MLTAHSLDDIVAAVRNAAAERAPLRIRGAGSKDFYGGLLAGEVLDVSAHRGIVAYEPTELYITAKCGTPLTEIEAALAEKGQMLAFEPPHFGSATVGGCVAGRSVRSWPTGRGRCGLRRGLRPGTPCWT